MPVACGSTVLNGSNGSVEFKPSGTSVCLSDFSDFPAGAGVITVPSSHGFKVGDAVQFYEDQGGNLDSGLTASTTGSQTNFLVSAVSAASPWTVTVTTAGGGAVTIAADGGTGSANSPAPAHINMKLADYTTCCHVRSFSLSLDREELDTTSLPCSVASAGGSMAPFRTAQPGFADGSGSMEVLFSEQSGTMNNRLINSAMKKDQDGAAVKLYINTVTTDGTTVDDAASMYIEGPVSIMGFSIDVTPDGLTVANLSFKFSGQPSVIQL